MIGRQPGPMLFTTQQDFVWTIFGSFYIGNLALVAITLAAIPLLAACAGAAKLRYPLVLGMILGPLLERSVRRSLVSSSGDLTEFVRSPIAVSLFAATALQPSVLRNRKAAAALLVEGAQAEIRPPAEEAGPHRCRRAPSHWPHCAGVPAKALRSTGPLTPGTTPVPVYCQKVQRSSG